MTIHIHVNSAPSEPPNRNRNTSQGYDRLLVEALRWVETPPLTPTLPSFFFLQKSEAYGCDMQR